MNPQAYSSNQDLVFCDPNLWLGDQWSCKVPCLEETIISILKYKLTCSASDQTNENDNELDHNKFTTPLLPHAFLSNKHQVTMLSDPIMIGYKP